MRLAAVLFIAVVGLVGCGKSKSNDSNASATTNPAQTIEAADFQFSPATFNVQAGQKVTITFKNVGQAEHNFSISSLNVNQDAEKGTTHTVTFTAPATAGDVQFFCEYHKDSKNMVGTLHVT
jgi:plastocyanin